MSFRQTLFHPLISRLETSYSAVCCVQKTLGRSGHTLAVAVGGAPLGHRGSLHGSGFTPIAPVQGRHLIELHLKSIKIRNQLHRSGWQPIAVHQWSPMIHRSPTGGLLRCHPQLRGDFDTTNGHRNFTDGH